MKKNKSIICIILLLLTCTQINVGAKKPDDFEIDTPLKALVLYFPSSSVLRCLNHSDIPRKLRKAFIHRNIKIPGEPLTEQKISIGADALRVSGKRFVFNAHELQDGIIYPMHINWEQAFGLGKHGELKSVETYLGKSLLEDVIGLQKKTKIKDKVGNQNLNYETFLKTTKGTVGDLNYNLELSGQDKIVEGKTRYFLNGKGKLGKDEILVVGIELDQDLYQINEKYGNIEIVTSIKVYD